MPYISTEEVKTKRDALKKEFPNVKFSVTKENCSSIHVHIMEAPFEIEEKEKDVNHFYIAEFYSHKPKVRDFLLKVKKIINDGNGIFVVDGDYGAVPNFYINIRFGKWDKPYKKIG